MAPRLASKVECLRGILAFVMFVGAWQGRPGAAAVAPGQFGPDVEILRNRASVLAKRFGTSPDLDSADPAEAFAFEDLFDNRRLVSKMLPNIKAHLDDEIEAFLAGKTADIPYCEMHLNSYGDALIQALGGQLTSDNFWAVEMLDATGKIPDGLLHGNFASLGDFDECLEVRASVNVSANFYKELLDDSKVDFLSSFKGQHCTLRLLPESFIQGKVSRMGDFSPTAGRSADIDPSALASGLPRLGICVPSTCSSKKLQGLLYNNDTMGLGIIPLVFDTNCYIDEAPSYSAGDIIVIFTLVLFSILAVVGTSLDYWFQRKKDATSGERGLATQALLSFSWLTNGKKLLSTKEGKSSLTCLHGIRFISMSWVVLGHTYAIGANNAFSNLGSKIVEMSSHGAFDAITNGTVSVDTFFFLSGMMVAYILFRDLEKTKGRFNLLLLYVHRYIRLTPPIAIAVGIFTTILPKLTSGGPHWSGAKATQEICSYEWWRILLYVQNIASFAPNVPEDRGLIIQLEGGVGCIGQLWYVAADMQMFLFAPFVLLPLFYWKSLASVAWLGFVTIGAILGPMFVYLKYDFLPTMIPGSSTSMEYFQKIYTAAFSRAGPYCVGLCMGYLLYKTKGKQIRMPKVVALTGWILASVTALSIIYGLRRYFSMDEVPRPVPSRVESIIYGGLHRSLWAMCVGWVVFACVHGYGGWINTFLSWKFFMPLGRLTYSSYIWSLNVQLIFQWSRKDVPYFDHPLMIYWFFGTMIITLSVAFVMSLLFESPFLGLEKIILAPCLRQSQNRPVTEVKPHDGKNGHANIVPNGGGAGYQNGGFYAGGEQGD